MTSVGPASRPSPPTPLRHAFPARPHAWRDVLTAKLSGFTTLRDRVGVRGAALATCARVRVIGANRLATPGPIILALNHLNNFEAIATPATLMLVRGGHVSFVADWTGLLYPGLGWFLTRSRAIVVWRKPARWRWLQRLVRRPARPRDALVQAVDVLAGGGCVALYPEGTRNRAPDRLLPARSGVARLALRTGVPVLPIGVDYDGRIHGRRATGWPHLTLRVGDLMTFDRDTAPTGDRVRTVTATVMHALADLSGKAVHPEQQMIVAAHQGSRCAS